MRQVYFTATPIGVNGTTRINGMAIAGFLCATTGTLTLTSDDGTVIINAQPVTAGTWTDMPFIIQPTTGGTVTLAAGASGTLAT